MSTSWSKGNEQLIRGCSEITWVWWFQEMAGSQSQSNMETWCMMSKIAASMYGVGRGFQCWSTSGSAGRYGWSGQPIVGLLLSTWYKMVLGNSLQPITEQYENMFLTMVYKMAAPCHEMLDNPKWRPPSVQWGRTSCCDVHLAELAGSGGNASQSQDTPCSHWGRALYRMTTPTDRKGRGQANHMTGREAGLPGAAG